ncbi:phosphate/phosphite/phosphonate ABC transporter substrate-binding protein [Breoghania sp. L-A4]|uniref:phosphate/phosphite/phosphonate ABC transporter substrate-binding protein n=1 Tax=Breoghania sp. L-A4 TaxID=2304600 RepID=UPI000E35E0DD|nr:phosphate/phosphite/phosphonate ABC transporter substrate-binding protein [Breoghania sp. L-A4]AXS38897.1 phosphate/phosphite/phosphonate ABC transporter substrate-binding protein [Breoghania sp. L-A4]
MTRIGRLLSLLLLAIVLGGVASSSALAQEDTGDWRAEQKVLRIGILATGGAERRVAAARPFEAYVSDVIGMPVELVPLRDMRVLIDAIVNARIDYAPLSASAYAAGWTLCRCLEPLAAPLAEDETAGFHAIVVTRADSGLRRLADLKDKALVYAQPSSVAGYLLPRAAFRAEGIEDETFFGRIGHAAGPVAAVTAMLKGEYDAALAWSSLEGEAASGYSRGTLRTMIAEGTLAMEDIRIVWQSRLIPHGPHVVRVNLAEELKTLLRAALFDLAAADPDAYDAIEPAFPGGFAAVSADSYAPLVQIFSR